MSEPTESEIAKIKRMECMRNTIASIHNQINQVVSIRCIDQEVCENCGFFKEVSDSNEQYYIRCTSGKCSHDFPEDCPFDNVSEIR